MLLLRNANSQLVFGTTPHQLSTQIYFHYSPEENANINLLIYVGKTGENALF